MKALVVYESMYGHTRDVAFAIGEGLTSVAWDVDVLEFASVPRAFADEVDLLIVGGPTHQFGMSRASSREMAAKDAAVPMVSRGIGIREWLGDQSIPRPTMGFATFDTTISKPRIIRYFGRALRKIARRLSGFGWRSVASPETFWVSTSTGPLDEGEQERARAWGRQLSLTVGEPTSVPNIPEQSHRV